MKGMLLCSCGITWETVSVQQKKHYSDLDHVGLNLVIFLKKWKEIGQFEQTLTCTISFRFFFLPLFDILYQIWYWYYDRTFSVVVLCSVVGWLMYYLFFMNMTASSLRSSSKQKEPNRTLLDTLHYRTIYIPYGMETQANQQEVAPRTQSQIIGWVSSRTHILLI